MPRSSSEEKSSRRKVDSLMRRGLPKPSRWRRIVGEELSYVAEDRRKLGERLKLPSGDSGLIFVWRGVPSKRPRCRRVVSVAREARNKTPSRREPASAAAKRDSRLSSGWRADACGATCALDEKPTLVPAAAEAPDAAAGHEPFEPVDLGNAHEGTSSVKLRRADRRLSSAFAGTSPRPRCRSLKLPEAGAGALSKGDTEWASSPTASVVWTRWRCASPCCSFVCLSAPALIERVPEASLSLIVLIDTCAVVEAAG